MENKTTFINGLIEGHLDPQVYQDLRRTFARETISFIKHGNLSITNTNPKLIGRVQFTECEISPFHRNDIDCSHVSTTSFQRQASTAKFGKQKIDLPVLQQLLVNSFSPDEFNKRPYPSAGGLYPVEPLVFLFQERINDFNGPSGCYHFRPISKKLQLIKKIDIHTFYEKILHGSVGSNPECWPNITILYLAHLGKAIFKYRYRGYRHAMMEAGSMFQHATFVSQECSLRTNVWSTFSEQEMLFELGLDHGMYLPLTTQLFGYGE